MKEIVISMVCTFVLAPILAFGIFAVSWWGTAPQQILPPPSHLAPRNTNTTTGPPGNEQVISTSMRPVSGRLLFLANCATCHGADGSGKGNLVLDRPARSFKDGGFSFGNTLPAIRRVIASGIPGTPMPGFKQTFTPAQQLSIARYVQSLGPPIRKSDPDTTRMVITDRPMIARGELASLGPDLPSHVRGFIAGGTDGLSWEYQMDDVRLLAIRQGGFVQRRNWDGRSGEPLQPLGRLIRLMDGGGPGPSFFVDGKKVRSHLKSTSFEPGSIAIDQTLDPGEVTIREIGRSISVGTFSGYARSFLIDNPRDVTIAIDLHIEDGAQKIGIDSRGIVWYRTAGPTGSTELTGLKNAALGEIDGSLVAIVSGGVDREVVVSTLLISDWNDSMSKALLEQDVSA